MLSKQEPEFFYINRETGECTWDKPKGEFQNTFCEIQNTFAEMFGMWVGRVLVTAANEKWARIAAETATGFASSIIMSPAEAGVEGAVMPQDTPDGRVGILVQIYHRTRANLKSQMILRIGQCVMTCPTAAAFDALPEAKRRLKVGRSLRLFGDGFQKKDELKGRSIWRIPVMEGEFKVEDSFGTAKAIAGGNFIILARNEAAGLQAAVEGVEAIRSKAKGVIMPFPGGVCRSGSKAGSLNYKLKASTSHVFCPKLRELVVDSQVPENAGCAYEVVVNGLNLARIENAMAVGVEAASKVSGVIRITAGNYGGKLGPYHAYLRKVLALERAS